MAADTLKIRELEAENEYLRRYISELRGYMVDSDMEKEDLRWKIFNLEDENRKFNRMGFFQRFVFLFG